MDSPSQDRRLCRIELKKEASNFSAAHFTIFSATERENLHGHNYQLECQCTARIDANGLIFDYAFLKKLLRTLCDEIDEKLILPAFSPYLRIVEEGDYLIAEFHNERLPFLRRDVTVLPIRNATIEEFAHYFLGKILKESQLSKEILALTVKVSSSPGQTGVAEWKRE